MWKPRYSGGKYSETFDERKGVMGFVDIRCINKYINSLENQASLGRDELLQTLQAGTSQDAPV